MKIVKIIVAALLLVFIAIQFYQPALNIDKGQVYRSDFTEVQKMPVEIKTILRTSCYDCHSNNTSYVWYDYVQPARAIVEDHIKKAKKDLNFNEWGNYSARKQDRLLSSIKEQVGTKEMPLSSYTLMHKKAKLNDAQIKLLIDWLQKQQ